MRWRSRRTLFYVASCVILPRDEARVLAQFAAFPRDARTSADPSRSQTSALAIYRLRTGHRHYQAARYLARCVPLAEKDTQPPLKIEAGKRVSQKINLTPLYPVHDFGTYHVRAHIYFADLSKFFYSQTKVFEVTDARPIWQRTVGIPEGTPASGKVRTYSLLTNRFPDHTSLYVRVEEKDSGIVYATYSLGHIIAFDEPQAELDRANQLHVLHCAAPRNWTYSHVGLNGELVSHSSFMETKTRPRLVHAVDGAVAVRGGMVETPVTQSERNPPPKLSDRPAEMPKGN